MRQTLLAALAGAVAAALVASAPALGAAKRISFKSPTGNIRCFIGEPFGTPAAACITLRPARAADIRQGRTVRVGKRSRVGGIRPGFTLAYGRQVRRLGFRCRSELRGMTCIEIETGRGFTICAEGVERLPGRARTACRARPAPRRAPARNCHPSYRPCVPNVLPRDLNCDDIKFPVLVVGPDVYKLDRDGDGRACGGD